MKTDPNQPAFPDAYTEEGSTGQGLTKLEYFSAMALQGILIYNSGADATRLAISAKGYALALIKVLNEPDDK